jgi:hypothetical protein
MQFHPFAYIVKLKIESMRRVFFCLFHWLLLITSRSSRQYVHITEVTLLTSLGSLSINRMLVSMADLIAKVSSTNTNWKDPGLSRTHDLSHITSCHHDSQPEIHLRPKSSHFKSYNSYSMSSDHELDDIRHVGELAPSRVAGLEVIMSSEVQIHSERRKSLGVSTQEGSELELGNIISRMGEDTEPLTAKDGRTVRGTAQRSRVEKGMGVHTEVWSS